MLTELFDLLNSTVAAVSSSPWGGFISALVGGGIVNFILEGIRKSYPKLVFKWENDGENRFQALAFAKEGRVWIKSYKQNGELYPLNKLLFEEQDYPIGSVAIGNKSKSKIILYYSKYRIIPSWIKILGGGKIHINSEYPEPSIKLTKRVRYLLREAIVKFTSPIRRTEPVKYFIARRRLQSAANRILKNYTGGTILFAMAQSVNGFTTVRIVNTLDPNFVNRQEFTIEMSMKEVISYLTENNDLPPGVSGRESDGWDFRIKDVPLSFIEDLSKIKNFFRKRDEVEFSMEDFRQQSSPLIRSERFNINWKYMLDDKKEYLLIETDSYSQIKIDLDAYIEGDEEKWVKVFNTDNFFYLDHTGHLTNINNGEKESLLVDQVKAKEILKYFEKRSLEKSGPY